jgi:hypothetical protein
LDRIFFWTAADLEAKLLDFQYFYNGYRTHAGLEGQPPKPIVDGTASRIDSDADRDVTLRIRHPQVNRKPVIDVEDFSQRIEQAKSQDNVLLLIQRGQNSLFAAVTSK